MKSVHGNVAQKTPSSRDMMQHNSSKLTAFSSPVIISGQRMTLMMIACSSQCTSMFCTLVITKRSGAGAKKNLPLLSSHIHAGQQIACTWINIITRWV